jgi:hypothetical protein
MAMYSLDVYKEIVEYVNNSGKIVKDACADIGVTSHAYYKGIELLGVGNKVKIFNTFKNMGEYTIMTLNHGQETKISNEDVNWISQSNWCARFQSKDNLYYVSGRNVFNNKTEPLARAIMNCPEDKVVDHINRDSLDNRRSNLKIRTQAENLRNRKRQKHATNKYLGVYPTKNGQHMVTRNFNNEYHYVGCFNNEKQAAWASDFDMMLLDYPEINLNLKHSEFSKLIIEENF